MNVLIYNAYVTLKSILGHAYDVMKVDAATLKTEPWESTCSLVVVPGGRDTPYCQDMHGPVNARIKAYVESGGRYLGLCAGAYYASANIEFEKGSPLEVVGSRELGFFPGTCRGTVYPGFVYNSEKGARAVAININGKTIQSYYNGGGYFVDAAQMDQVKTICTYQDKQEAAGVQCQIGKGHALLFGIHPEYNINLVDLSDNDNKEEITKELKASLPLCQEFLRQSLANLGLNVQKENTVLELTPLYLSTISGHLLKAITQKLSQNLDTNAAFVDSNDTFYVSEISQEAIHGLPDMLEKMSLVKQSEDKPPVLKILYPFLMSDEKTIHVPEKALTPMFDIKAYFEALLARRQQEWGGGAWYRFGNAMLYSQVITSTQTVLDKNYNFAQCLPSGLVCLATNQIAGRGRGRNSWVSQAGALQFSFVVRHSVKLSNAPVVFIQYLIALAIVESIRTLPGYEDVPLRLKWPNDIYADMPAGLLKVGGLLVNSSFVRDEFLLVIGCGINLNNPHPTVSINDVIQQHNPKLERLGREQVLAHALVTFEKYYMELCEKGMGSWFLDKYYKRWLHSDKLVTLTTHNDEKARIVGITSDYGMLEAVSVNDPRKRFTLQPDGNSFDMLKGLIIKKT
ncbi:biotin holocarboxylase synthetase [Rhizopus stolonifer]|uniref:Biotin holocarboxylase synthetase n=1 Tax=Rhizopus stolonifer TaxID=4846 RepID=A0A367KSA4_RHIST|nr:biotin holocarboxylase synthetase [Rhizopus stolonifer]